MLLINSKNKVERKIKSLKILKWTKRRSRNQEAWICTQQLQSKIRKNIHQKIKISTWNLQTTFKLLKWIKWKKLRSIKMKSSLRKMRMNKLKKISQNKREGEQQIISRSFKLKRQLKLCMKGREERRIKKKRKRIFHLITLNLKKWKSRKMHFYLS